MGLLSAAPVPAPSQGVGPRRGRAEAMGQHVTGDSAQGHPSTPPHHPQPQHEHQHQLTKEIFIESEVAAVRGGPGAAPRDPRAGWLGSA